jgi:hypothetical protein
MSFGLRVWDTSGNLTLDVTDRITRLIQNIDVYFPDGVGQVNITIPGLDISSWAIYSNSSLMIVEAYTGYVACYNGNRSLGGTILTLSAKFSVFRF